MRLRPGWALAIIVVAAGLTLSSILPKPPMTLKAEHSSVPEHLRIQSIRSPAFVLSADRWLNFDLTESPTRVRVLTNANLRSEVNALSDEEVLAREWTYRIRYELLGPGNAVLHSGTYHFRAKLDRYRDPESGDHFLARFYDGIPSVLAATCETTLDPRSSSVKPRWLRIQLESADPEIDEVITRFYCLNERTDSQLDKTWHELSDARRELLAAGSVYPHDLLGTAERRNLLRSIWSPQAPTGYEGISYTQRPLLVLRDIEPFQVQQIPSPNGFLVYDQFHAMLPVPDTPGRVRLTFQGFSQSELPIAPQSVKLSWHGKRIHERRVTTIRFPPLAETWDPSADGDYAADSATLQTKDVLTATSIRPNCWICDMESSPGLYELQSLTPLIVNADWQPSVSGTDSNRQDITPPAMHQRTYATMTDLPVNFAVPHLEDSQTIVRVTLCAAAGQARPMVTTWTDSDGRRKADLNSVFADSSATIPFSVKASVEWRYLDEHDTLLCTGILTRDLSWSDYDRLSDEVLTTRVSEPSDFYLDIPHNVAKLQLVTTQSPLLLAAATRPLDVPKVTAVPEDYSSFSRGDTNNRSWFSIRAIDHDERIQYGLSPVIVTQTLPPEDDEEIAAGRYTWEDFPPTGEWLGRYVLTPRDPAQPMSDDSTSAMFYEVTANSTWQSRLLGDPGRRTVSLALTYQFHDSVPSPLRFFVDDELIQEIRPQSVSGDVVLLSCLALPDEQSIRVECDVPVQLWMNRIAPRDGQPWSKRLAVEFNRSAFEFVYHKQLTEEEHVSLSVFRPQSATERLDLRVSIRPVLTVDSSEPMRDFTFRERVFSLAPGDVGSSLMLPSSRDLHFDGGRGCLIPFGLDLPPGDYVIEIERTSDNHHEHEPKHNPSTEPIYFILSRTSSGLSDVRDISIETLASEL